MNTPNISYTVQHDICTGCGICQGACPNDAIRFAVNNGEFRPVVNREKCNNNKGCHRCYDVCPGLGVNLIDDARQLYDETNVKENKYIGRYIECYTGYSTDKDLRYHSASGGLLSQFLIWLLEKGYIDGAVITRFDQQNPLKVKTFIATSPDEVKSGKSSKYGPVAFNHVAADIKAASGNRYIVVGLPCHVEGLRELTSIDKKLREKIAGIFSLYCSGTRTFNFTEYILKSRGLDIEKVNYLAYRDNGCLGGMVVKGDGIDYFEDYQRYSHPLRTIFHPRRCLLCADHFGELADVCFGDIHVKPYSDDKIGINSVVVRTNYWDQIIKQACEEGVISLDVVGEDVLLSSQKMAIIKKNRNIAYTLLNKKFHRVVPEYGNTYGAKISAKVVLNYIRMSIERFIGKNRSLWWIIPCIKSKVNIH